jgi:hypothetical protein
MNGKQPVFVHDALHLLEAGAEAILAQLTRHTISPIGATAFFKNPLNPLGIGIIPGLPALPFLLPCVIATGRYLKKRCPLYHSVFRVYLDKCVDHLWRLAK